MLLSLLNKLYCPYSHEDFDIIILKENEYLNIFPKEIELALLITKSKKNIYPVYNGIPRMLPDSLFVYKRYFSEFIEDLILNDRNAFNNYLKENHSLGEGFIHAQKSFSSEWSEIKDDDKAWGRSTEERESEVFHRLSISEKDLDGKFFFDVGCGHGEIEIALKDNNIELFAMDLSFSVDDLRLRLKKLNSKAIIHLIQGNAHYPPFKSDSFDFVFSDGVLHHTPNTRKGFESVSKTLKNEGKCFIMVYSCDNKDLLDLWIYKFILFSTRFFNNLPHKLLHLICYILAPLYWVYLRIYVLFKKGRRRTNRSLKELSLSLFDAFSPKYYWHHSTEEVIGWYKELGYKDISKTYNNHVGIGIVGTKG